MNPQETLGLWGGEKKTRHRAAKQRGGELGDGRKINKPDCSGLGGKKGLRRAQEKSPKLTRNGKGMESRACVRIQRAPEPRIHERETRAVRKGARRCNHRAPGF